MGVSFYSVQDGTLNQVLLLKWSYKSVVLCFAIACVASVSVLFRSKERPTSEIFGFGRAKNGTRLSLLGLSLLRNSKETLATQASFASKPVTDSSLLSEQNQCFQSLAGRTLLLIRFQHFMTLEGL